MEQNKFSITSKTDKSIEIAIEPEGTILTLHRTDSVEIVVQSDKPDEVSFNIYLSEIDNKFMLSIWPVSGDYKIFKDGKEFDKIYGNN